MFVVLLSLLNKILSRFVLETVLIAGLDYTHIGLVSFFLYILHLVLPTMIADFIDPSLVPIPSVSDLYSVTFARFFCIFHLPKLGMVMHVEARISFIFH